MRLSSYYTNCYVTENALVLKDTLQLVETIIKVVEYQVKGSGICLTLKTPNLPGIRFCLPSNWSHCYPRSSLHWLQMMEVESLMMLHWKVSL